MRHLLRILYYFFLMVKEVILGKATLTEAYRYDPRRVYTLGFFMLSVALNVIFFLALRNSIEETHRLREQICIFSDDKPPPLDINTEVLKALEDEL